MNDRKSLIGVDMVKLWVLDTRRCRHNPSACSVGYGKSSMLGGTRDDSQRKSCTFND